MATMAATVSGHGAHVRSVESGKTEAVYSLIRDGKHAEAVAILEDALSSAPNSRAALSLLAYCYYALQDFPRAAAMYETLVRNYNVEEYKVLLAQSYFKAGLYAEASKAAARVTDVQFHQRMQHLRANISYTQGELASAQSFLNKCIEGDPETIIAKGCLLYKEGDVEGARRCFVEAQQLLGYQPHLAYNIALCYFKQEQYGPALKVLPEIIERGVQEHPELAVGSNSEDVRVRSVGNSRALESSALVEAFNLKSAIEFKLGNTDLAAKALEDMPPRSDAELDPVTLQNQALLQMEKNPKEGFRKLNFLLSVEPSPPETLGNLLLLYVQYGYEALAADTLAEYSHLHETCLSESLYEFLEATVLAAASPDDAYSKFDALAKKHVEQLRKLTKDITDAGRTRDDTALQAAVKQYKMAVTQYAPIVLSMARLLYDKGKYKQIENLFKANAEFLSDHDKFRLCVGHVLYVQERYKEAARYYAQCVNEDEDLLSVPAIVLANLCVSYIMTSQNEKAEELMRAIEQEEDIVQQENPERQVFSLTMVNIAIGSLYAAKNNYAFGISRIVKSLQPYEKRLAADTWFYAKKVLLSLVEGLAKQMVVVGDDTIEELLIFLDDCQEHGSEIDTSSTRANQGDAANGAPPDDDDAEHTVASEARALKCMVLKLREG